MPTFRTFKCPMGVYKVNETCGCPIEETGYSFDYLPGQHTHYGRDRNFGQSTSTNSLQSAGDSRICNKLPEIQFLPIKKDGITGIFNRLPSYDPCPSSKQNSKSKERVSEPPRLAVVTVQELPRFLVILLLLSRLSFQPPYTFVTYRKTKTML